MKTLLIFDLDGTLIHSGEVVLPAFRKALSQFSGVPIPSEDVMLSTFGHPDEEIWKMLMPGASDEQRREAFALSEHYIEELLYTTNILLPEAREVLSELASRGYTLTTASNCGETYLNAVLDSQKIRSLFRSPLCLGTVNGRVKADILTEHFRMFDRTEAVMIGDRSSDVEAAASHDIPIVGCNFVGFGENDELQGVSPVIQHLSELLPMFPALQD